jgi:hypothetical protein
LLFSNKITQAIYTILGKKLKKSAEMSEKYEIRGDVSKADRRSFNHGGEDSSNNENIIKSVQNDVGKDSEGKSDQEKQEITIGNSEDKSDEGKYSQINNEVMLSQDLQCDGENEHSQDNRDNNQSENDKDKTVETHRTSSRTKKIPSKGVKIFYGEQDTHSEKLYKHKKAN